MELDGSTVSVRSESGIASATDSDFAKVNPRYGVWEITAAGNGVSHGFVSRWNSITIGKTIGNALRAEIGAVPVGTTLALVGTTAGNNAASGNLGEFVSATVALEKAVGLLGGLAADVAQIRLSAGDWDVQGSINLITSNPRACQLEGGISANTAVLPADGSEVYSFVQSSGSAAISGITIPRKRVNVASATTVYLVAKADFSAGSASAFGQISARRVR
jgi:hypothetical protein